MKTIPTARLTALAALLSQVADDVRPGGQAEVSFKAAQVEVQSLIDLPAAEPEKIHVVEVATDALAAKVAAALQPALADKIGALQIIAQGNADALAGMDNKLIVVESELQQLIAAQPVPATTNTAAG